MPDQISLLQPLTSSKPYAHLVTEMEKGELKIPDFQRPFVWKKEQTAKLLDSIIRGYPIGSFIFWQTRDRLMHMRNIGNFDLPEPRADDRILYILDGQQRITSLFAVRKGLVFREQGGAEIDYKDIYIDLEASLEGEADIVVVEKADGDHYISVFRLLNDDFLSILEGYPREYAKKIQGYYKKLDSYSFTTITLDNYPIDVACEVFTRLNTGGTILSLFDIMVAKTYDEPRQFNLAKKFAALRDGDDQPNLASVKYDPLAGIIAAQCAAAILTDEIQRSKMLALPKNDFIDAWAETTASLRKAIDFARTALGALVYQLLPYPAALIPLAWFFAKNGGKDPDAIQKKRLMQLFFWIALTSRYSSATESKVASDIKKTEKILAGEAPDYGNDMIKLNPATFGQTWFSAGNAICKAVLCLLALQNPKSFKSDTAVILDNSWLSRSNSRNYHHFFPRAWLRKKNYDDWQQNCVANITLVKADENLDIGAKPPAQYIAKFASDNPNIDADLASQLIPDRQAIEANDYDAFISRRGKLIADKLNAILACK